MNPRIATLLESGHDLELHKQHLDEAYEVLRVREERYRAAFHTSLDAIAICRMDDGMFVDVNARFFEILGYSREELVGQTSTEVSTWRDAEGNLHAHKFLDVAGRSSQELNIWCDPADWERLKGKLRANSICDNFQTRMRKKGGELFWAQLSASTLELEGVQCVLYVTHDITPIRDAEDRIRTLSNYDPLTQLPNRRFALERLGRILCQRDREPQHGAVLLIDLDDFKSINSYMGPIVGDLMLQQAAQRICASIRSMDTAARTAGDEFAVILERLGADREEAGSQAQSVARRLIESLAEPYCISNHACRCTASIGIAMFAHAGNSAEDIFQQCSIAMHQAHAAGQNTYRFFFRDLQEKLNRRAALEEELREASGSDQLYLCYQPQVKNDAVVGAEALVRWQHPARGRLSPGEFISIAEESELILALGNQVLEAACRQSARWARDRRFRKLAIAVNISARHLRQPRFVNRVLEIVADCRADPRNLEIELTETSLVDDTEKLFGVLSELRAHGVRIAVDDFGTGYSSLSHLIQLPIDKLKIDLSFIRNISTDPIRRAVVKALLSMCASINLDVIAEGVESIEQRDILLGLGCRSFQGYLFGKPMVAEEFEQLICTGAAQCAERARQ